MARRSRAQYSSLKQVNRGNVTQLKPVWIASTGDEAITFNPLVIGDTLYALAEKDHILALDAATGKQKWSHKHPCKDAARARRHRNNLE